MNERIQELLLEAHRRTSGGIYNGHPSEWSEKFAKLIVKECMNVAYLCSHADCYNGDEFIHAGDKIKEHFGVE